MLNELKTGILWMDVDTVINAVPVKVDALVGIADMAAAPFVGTCHIQPPLLTRSTTMMFNYTPAAITLVERWADWCAQCTAGVITDPLLQGLIDGWAEQMKGDDPTKKIGDHRLIDALVRHNGLPGYPWFAFRYLPEPYARIGPGNGEPPVCTIGLAVEVASRRETMKRVPEAHRKTR